jgi:hypothetical protein
VKLSRDQRCEWIDGSSHGMSGFETVVKTKERSRMAGDFRITALLVLRSLRAAPGRPPFSTVRAATLPQSRADYVACTTSLSASRACLCRPKGTLAGAAGAGAVTGFAGRSRRSGRPDACMAQRGYTRRTLTPTWHKGVDNDEHRQIVPVGDAVDLVLHRAGVSIDKIWIGGGGSERTPAA